MALILCPNCGKKVSSSAENCIHCGCALKEIGEARNYKSLTSGEMNALLKEFHTLNPEFEEYEKEKDKNIDCFNRYSRVLQIMAIVGLLAIAGSIWAIFAIGANSKVLSASFSEKPITYLPTVAFGLGATCYFLIIVLGIVRFPLKHYLEKRIIINELIIMTKYKVWLKEAKNIDYEITGIKDKYMDYIRDFEYDGVNKLKLKRS